MFSFLFRLSFSCLPACHRNKYWFLVYLVIPIGYIIWCLIFIPFQFYSTIYISYYLPNIIMQYSSVDFISFHFTQVSQINRLVLGLTVWISEERSFKRAITSSSQTQFINHGFIISQWGDDIVSALLAKWSGLCMRFGIRWTWIGSISWCKFYNMQI